MIDGARGKSLFDFRFQIIQFSLYDSPLVEILFNHDATALHVVEVSNWCTNGTVLKALKRALVSWGGCGGLNCVDAGLVLEIDGH